MKTNNYYACLCTALMAVLSLMQSCSKEMDMVGTVGSPVDLGLSVYWADHNLGGTHEVDSGLEMHNTIVDRNGKVMDSARKIWGRKWYVPTMEDLNELIAKCSWERCNTGTVEGYRVTGPNGKSVFLPYQDKNGSPLDYWSSEVDKSHAPNIGFMYMNHTYADISFSESLMTKHIRPVMKKKHKHHFTMF